MATRKQRRRREKTFRHEYGFVVSDEEGNQVELAGSELRSRKETPEKAKPAAAKGKPAAKGRSARATRDPDPPTWHRSLRRGLIWSPIMVLLSYIVFRTEPVAIRVLIGLVYAGLFIPMSYWIDAMVYRRSEKRKAAGVSRPGKTR
jgi:hypothetical protein